MRSAFRILIGLILALMLLSGCAQAPIRPAPEAKPAEVVDRGDAVAADAATETAGPKTRALTIELGRQRFVYSEDDHVVRTGPISSGREGYVTPKGQFSVLSKQKDKVSSRYQNQLGWPAWMPYSIQFHGHYFLHEGWLPGHPDSHGCVRVGEQDARFLFERMKIGDRVAVVD